MRKLLVVVASLALLAGPGGAGAQVYPSHPLTMVVPFAADGPNDGIARALAGRMAVSLGQPITIENIDGAAGSIGTGRLARAAPDGYTLGIGYWGTHVANGVLYGLDYDVVNDFAPISLLVESPLLIVANKATPASNLKELVGWLKQNPDKSSWAVPGSGSHVASVFFQKETGTRFRLVPYRGAGPAIQDIASGRIDMAMLNVGPVLPQVRAGAIKAYAVTAKSRLAAAPDIPTVDEAGFPGLYSSVWFGFWAPAKTPQEVIARLNAATVEALADPTVRARLRDLAQEILPRDQQTPEALAALQKSEIAKWWPIIKAAGIKGE
ncbi:MAG TPA: tripartite tricarboxylate transporter substrate-binding protein [Xanthobacteraceae bacterium]|jgi:tripartite-type tricarboxylate transporter receptor subunit TctC